jgi:hypothetical protein
MSYQEGITNTTGACPIVSSGFYAAKHDPFVFFRDVSGSPPSKTNSGCASHHKDYSQLAADLANHAVASFNFITPNLCHDAKTGYAGAVPYDHGSMLKSIERILEVPVLATVSGANDFTDLFVAGFFP